ncbi:MAG: mediator of RNA polymerase II transcription subunit 13 [Sclerophora amabilis]|nr:MAG: mediator of RNA polymerase II transcription subunit 13 [Sclerophora amabilis]
MEFPGSCLTNAFQIQNCSSIDYHIFTLPQDIPRDDFNFAGARTLESTDTSAHATPKPPSPNSRQQSLNALRQAEASCKRQGILVSCDVDMLELWLFEAGEQATLVSELVGVAKAHDYNQITLEGGKTLRLSSSGVFKSSIFDKARLPPAPQSGPPISAPATSATFDQSHRASQVLNARAAQANRSLSTPSSSTLYPSSTAGTAPNVQEDINKASHVYGLLMAAILSCLCFRLAESQEFLPFNFRTLITPQNTASPFTTKSTSQSCESSSEVNLTTLDAYMTTDGTLMILSSTVRQGSLSRIVQNPQGMSNPYLRAGATNIWLAPGGVVGRFMGFEVDCGVERRPEDVPSQTPFRNGTPGIARARLATNIETWQWKSDVITWLREQGVAFSSHEQELKWLQVRIWTLGGSPVAEAREDYLDDEKSQITILWPCLLCFKKTDLKEILPGEETGASWFESPQGVGIHDPLTFAEEWFAQKQTREDDLKSRQDDQRAQELLKEQELASLFSHQNSDGALSPSGSIPRTNSHVDHHTATGVYPTPPDGIQSQGQNTGNGADGTEALPENSMSQTTPGDQVIEPTKDTNMEGQGTDPDMWISSEKQEDGDENAKPKNENGTDFDLPSGDGIGDELFLDDDMFDEPGATDPDFSFFDEPDIEDNGQHAQGTEAIASHQYDLVDLDNNKDATGASPQMVNTEPDPPQPQNPNPTQNPAVKEEVRKDDPFIEIAPEGDNGSDDNTTLPIRESSDIHEEEVSEVAGLASVKESVAHIISPPLSPSGVMDIIMPHNKEISPSRTNPEVITSPPTREESLKGGTTEALQKTSRFDYIPFNAVLDASMKKYDSKGRFWFTYEGRKDTLSTRSREKEVFKTRPLPELRVSKRNRPHHRAENPDHLLTSAPGKLSPACLASDDENASQATEEEGQTTCSESQFSDSDDLSEAAEDLSYSFPVSRKRKRALEDDGDSRASSLHRSNVDSAAEPDQANVATATSWDNLAPNPADWPLTELFRTGDNEYDLTLGLNDKDFIDVGQVLVDQVTSGPWNALETLLHDSDAIPLSASAEGSRQDGFESAVEAVFSNATQCNLEDYNTVEDTPLEVVASVPRLLTQPKPDPARPNRRNSQSLTNEDCSQKSVITEVLPPHILLQRGETPLEVSPPALDFWETFGFGPCSGPKDVSAFCIHPHSDSLDGDVDAFLETIASVYEGCRLGIHDRGNLEEYTDGLVPVSLGTSAAGGTDIPLRAIEKTCKHLGLLLSQSDIVLHNVVVYLINPFTHPGAYVDLCTAFTSLFHAYIKPPAVQQSNNVSEIVLKILPIGFIASKTSIALPTRAEHTKLALEIYDRCVASDGAKDQANGPAPSILLSQPPPKNIDFKLISEPSSSLLNENSCLHIAYACSVDDRWITAAWSDSRGGLQNCTAYCLRRTHSSASRPLSDVFREIWETSVEIVRRKGVRYRIMLAKAGNMYDEEVEAWTSLSSQTPPSLATLTLLTTDTDTLSLHQLPNPDLPLPSSATPQESKNVYNTPVSTPQANVQSPDQHGNTAAAHTPNAATPTDTTNSSTANNALPDLDADATLVDISDNTWSVILAHRLRNSNSIIDYRPALASGLLIKQGDGVHPVTMAVSLILAPSVPPQQQQRQPQKMYDDIVGEVLGIYRRLGNLARWRETVDPVRGVMPWHIAAAVKAQQALTVLM